MAKKQHELAEANDSQLLAEILDELRRIRSAIEHPKDTALRELGQLRETVTT